MTIRTDRQYLKTQLLETQRLQQLSAGHPLMAHALNVRESELNQKASQAFERVSETQSEDETVILEGTFKGVLLDSWDFNFTTIDGESIKGKLGQELSEDQVIEFNARYFNQRCVASLLKTTASFKNGRSRVTYQLLDISPASA